MLRVVRKGPTVKDAVDNAVDQCAEVFNLRDSIEELRIMAEQSTDERQKRQYAQKGILTTLVVILLLTSNNRLAQLETVLRAAHFPGLLAINTARHHAFF